MKIGFFGTPEIAAYCLQHLKNYFEIAFVVTAPDKPKGRGRQVSSPPVKERALEFGIPCYQPTHLHQPDLQDILKSHGCDIFVVVAYGKIIPESIFSLPPLGTINLHPSLLPQYRGAAPIEWALYNGETQTGITVQRINAELDAGDIVLQLPVTIGPDETTHDVYERITPMGAALLVDAIVGLQNGTIVPKPQDHSKATYCGKITHEIARIDWGKSASSIHNMVRAFNPKPVAWTTFRGRLIKIWRTKLTDNVRISIPPSYLYINDHRLYVGTGEGIVEIVQLQPETKKVMDAKAFLNGYRIQEGERFE